MAAVKSRPSDHKPGYGHATVESNGATSLFRPSGTIAADDEDKESINNTSNRTPLPKEFTLGKFSDDSEDDM